MLFKRRYPTVGNFVFSDGVKAIFNDDGMYSTDKKKYIEELQAETENYIEVSGNSTAPLAKTSSTLEKLGKAVTGMQSTNTLEKQ